MRSTPHEDRGPTGSSTRGPSGRVCKRPPAHFGTPLTRIVPPPPLPLLRRVVCRAWIPCCSSRSRLSR
eukprot:5794724-Pyramimonas_sp.AAC.1